MDFLTPKQIEDSAKKLVAAFEAGQISSKQFNDGMEDVTKKLQGYSAELSANLNQLGTASKKLGEAMLQGASGASVYNEAMTSAAMTSAVVLTGMFGPLGAAVGALIKVFTFAVGQVNEMSDSLYKANQDMSKIGATGAEGMTGVFDNMQKFGYGIKDLGDMTALLAKNSNNLAMMSGTVEQGANQFANVAKGIKNSDLQRQFMNMGMSVNDINNGIGEYLSIQSRLGIISNESIEEQTQHAAEYIEQQDKLTKITGQNADKLKSNQQKAEQLENWNALLATMQPAEAAKMQAAFDRLAQTSEGAAMGFAASATGMTGLTKDSSEQFMITGGASVELAQQFQNNIKSGMDVTKATGILQQGWADATAANKDTAVLMAKGGASFGGGKIQEITATAALAGGKALKATESAEAAQDGQAKGTDKLLNEHTMMLQKQMDARDSMQGLIKEGIGPVTEGMKGLSDIIDSILHPGWLWGQGKGKKEQGAGSGISAVAPASGSKAALLDVIGKGETTTGDYNKLVGGKKGVANDADLTNMSIAQVMEYQKGMIAAGHSSTAVGKYQMIASTLAEQAKAAGLDINKVKFNAGTQDLLAGQLIDKAGYGKVDNATLMSNLSKTWASLPKDQSGAGYYDGKNGNKAHITPDEVMAALSKTSESPATAKSGYQSTDLASAQNNMPTAKAAASTSSDSSPAGMGSMTPYQKQMYAAQLAQTEANEARAKAVKAQVTAQSG